MASRRGSGLWFGALGCLAALYIACLGGKQIHPAFGDGPSVYTVSAESLARGTGYRLINYPEAPPSQLYPVGYPLLLSFIFRVVPFGPTAVLLARMIAVISTVVFVEAARRLLKYAVNPSLAAWIAVGIGLTPLAIEMSGQIKADLLFGAIVMITMVIALGTSASDTGRQLFLRGVALGVFASCSMLVRTIGFTLVFGLALEMLLRRRWLQLLGFAAAGALVLGPWMIWTFFNNGTFHSYASENAITWQTPFSHFWLLTTFTAPTMVFAPFQTSGWHDISAHLHLEWIMVGLGFGIVGLVILGWASLLRQRHVIALVLAPYMGIVFLWWFEPTRFVVPVLPLIVFCAAVGAKMVFSGLSIPVRKLVLLGAVICIGGGIIVDAVSVRRIWHFGNIEGAEAAADWTQMQKGLDWIKSNTPPDAVVFSSYPAGVYLFTGRHTLDLNNGVHIGTKYSPIGGMDLDEQFRKASAFPSAYVYATYRFDYLTNREWGVAPVQRFIESHPGRLDLQWASSDGHLSIYKVSPL